MKYKNYVNSIISEIDSELKTPYNRYQMILIIKRHGGDEFETAEDVWDLAMQTDTEIASNLQNMKEYYLRIKEEYHYETEL